MVSAEVPSPSPTPTRPLRKRIVALLVAGFACGFIPYSCMPASQRITQPIVCPAGTVDSVVVSHVERNERGTIVTKFDLRCIDRDGGSVDPPGVYVIGTMSAYGLGLALLVALALAARRRLAPAALAALALVVSGCEVGTLTRAEFETRYPYGAGPMFSRGWAETSVRALQRELAGPAHVVSVSVSPETVSFSVVARGSQRDVDVHTYRHTGFSDPFPTQTSDADDDATRAFDLEPAMLAPISQLVRTAPAQVGIADGHVTNVSFSKDRGQFRFFVSVESPHRRGSARYDAAGALIDATRD